MLVRCIRSMPSLFSAMMILSRKEGKVKVRKEGRVEGRNEGWNQLQTSPDQGRKEGREGGRKEDDMKEGENRRKEGTGITSILNNADINHFMIGK